MRQANVVELAPRRARRAAAERVFHVVDLENLLGGPGFTAGEAEALCGVYRRTAGDGRGREVIATSHFCALEAWYGWPSGALRRVRSGPDGADQVLLDSLRDLRLEGVDRVVIGSGDGIFAAEAARLQAAGVQVSVVCRPSSVSRRLTLAVKDIRFLPAEGGDPLLAVAA